MKANFKRDKREQLPIILSGKGKEWSEVSNEINNELYNWLSFSKLSMDELNQYMQSKDFTFEIVEVENGNRGIIFIADNNIVGTPVMYEKRSGYNAKDFLVDAMLLFLHIGSLFSSDEYNTAFQEFFKEENLYRYFL